MKKGRQKKKSIDNNAVKAKKWLILLIGAFLLIVIIKIILSMRFYSPFILYDEIFYDSLARNILNGKLYPIIGVTRSPGYPLILSIAYLLTDKGGETYHIMLAVSSIISTSIIFPSYQILRKYCPEKTSLLGAVLAAVLPLMNIYSFTIMSEVLFIPLFTFSVWALIEAYGTDDLKWQLMAAVTVVYLYMTRSNGLGICVAFVASFLYYAYINRKQESIAGLILKKGFLILSFLILFIAWGAYSMIFQDSIFSIDSIVFIVSVAIGLLIMYRIFEGRIRLPDRLGSIIRRPRSFAIGLSATIITSAVSIFVVMKSPGNAYYSFGSAFNIVGVCIHLLDPFTSLSSFYLFLEILANDTAYLFICSFFFLSCLIFYYIVLLRDKKLDLSAPASIAGFYVLMSFLLLMLSIVALRFYGGEPYTILGRYIDPVVPVVILFGIVTICRLNDIGYNKYSLVFSIVFIMLTLATIAVLEYNLTIISGFIDIQNNEAIYFLNSIYQASFPEVVIMAFAMILLALFVLSINDKRYADVLVGFVILVSILSSIGIYNDIVDNSNFRANNPINQLLSANSERNTILILDDPVNETDSKIELGIYGFWNAGSTIFQNASDSTTIAKYSGNDTYMISRESLPYRLMAEDGPFKIYSV